MIIKIDKADALWILFMAAILFTVTYCETPPGDAAHFAAGVFASLMIAAVIHLGVSISCEEVRKFRKREKDGKDKDADD